MILNPVFYLKHVLKKRKNEPKLGNQPAEDTNILCKTVPSICFLEPAAEKASE